MLFLILIVQVTFTVAQYSSTTETAYTETTSLNYAVTEEKHNIENDTTCEENSEVCPNTTYLNATTIQPNNITVPKVKPSSTERNLEKVYCTCDLQDNFCDVNCCCDDDCSKENKEVFQYCLPEPRFYDARFCDYMKYIYINNTPVQWHINQNGLFCIIKSNYPKSYIVQRKDPIKNFSQSRLERMNKFSWSKASSQINDVFNSSLKLIYGNPVWLLNKKGFYKFGIPNSFVTNNCLIKEEVLYLKNVETVCHQTDINEDNPYLNLKYYYDDVLFVSRPRLVNVTKWKQKSPENCPKDVCLPVVPQICDDGFDNCEYILKNSSKLTNRCNFTLSSKTNTCYNIVKKLQYNIFHNGTKGFNSVSLLVVMDNITYELGGDPIEFKQEFSVNFFWTNSTKKNIRNLSGNPGYLIGKPILTSTLLNIKNGTDTVIKLVRDSTNSLDSVYVIPKNIQGECVLNKTEHTTLKFGFNQINKCRFRTTVFNNNKKTANGTELCRAVQRTLLEIWNIKNDTMVSFFGNADVSNLNDWQQILHKMNPSELINITTGLYSSKNRYIFCSNLVSELEVDIFHSRIDIDSLLNQEKILALTVSFGGFTNRSLYFRKNSSSLYFETQLKTSVTFYDLTVKKERKAVSSPSLNIRLPYDFFYPFVRVNNGSFAIRFNFPLIFLLLMCVIFLNK